MTATSEEMYLSTQFVYNQEDQLTALIIHVLAIKFSQQSALAVVAMPLKLTKLEMEQLSQYSALRGIVETFIIAVWHLTL